MKKFYDKLLLLLAFLVLLGGGALYMTKTEEVAAQDTVPNLQPAENPYEPVSIPEFENEESFWPEPEHQSSGPNWLYGVFTPPKIYIDAEGNFTPVPPQVSVEKPEPFGIYLVSMNRELYRLQLQGFSGNRNKPEEAVLFIIDEERNVKYFVREGEAKDIADFEVLDFAIDREVDEEKGSINVIATAIILDKRTGKEIKLNDEEVRYSSNVTLVFASEQNPEVEIEREVKPENPVATFETPLGSYELLEINLEERTVTVEKKATEESEAKTLTLSPTDNNQLEATEPEKEESEAPSSEEDEFDFGF